jgi:hypothetical protein
MHKTTVQQTSRSIRHLIMRFGTEPLQPVLPAVRPILIGLDHDFSYLVLLGWRPRPRRTPSW